VNGYVAAGWSVTAVILALYTWRLIRRGHLLTRALPDEAPAVPFPAGTASPSGHAPSAEGTASKRSATVPGPGPQVGAWQ
jgi:hypothetical protein